jgi:Ran GTPase-activating protein (RanGAP) involved in mRNA processing and transport
VSLSKSLSFKEHALAFFLRDPETLTDSPWVPFLEYEYLRDYFHLLEKLEEDEKKIIESSEDSGDENENEEEEEEFKKPKTRSVTKAQLHR